MNAIVAFCKNFGIGKKNQLPWVIPEDMKRFYNLTKGGIVVMGKQTYLSLNSPLKDRKHYVLSRTFSEDRPNVRFFKTDTSLVNRLAQDIYDKEKIFLIGGAEIFQNKLLMDLCERLYVTYIDKDYDCDTFFEFKDYWKLENYSDKQWSDNEQTYYRFLDYSKTYGYEEKKYLNLLKEVVDKGVSKEDRTMVGTKSLFGKTLEFDISESVPVFTHRRIAWKHCIEELLWFIQGSTDVKRLQEKKVKIWDGNSSREFLDKQGLTEYDEGDIGPCFFKNTPVLTSNGYTFIEKIKEGDFVLTHNGNWKLVTKTLKREYRGAYNLIQTDYLPDIKCTPEHPILTRKKQWKLAKNITTDDYIGLKINTQQIDYIKNFTESGWFLLGYLFNKGMYSAEQKDIVLYLPQEHYNTLEPLIKSLVKFYNKQNNLYSINEIVWVNLFSHFMRDSLTKKIPEWLQSTPKDDINSFLEGFLMSHDYVNGSVNITCENEDTAYSLFRLFIKCGKIVKVQRSVNDKGGYTWNLKYSDNTPTGDTLVEDNYIWVKVQRTESDKIDYAYVYNLEVDDDNSYTVSNQHVHNCYGFQWKHFGADYVNCKTDYQGKGVNQIAYILNLLKTDPMSRRMVLSAWNPSDLEAMALAPCHYSSVFNVYYDKDRTPILNCMVTLRSNDLVLGCPFNIFSYCVLTQILALKAGMKPGKLMLAISDAHVYSDHINAIEKMLYPKIDTLRPLPRLIINPDIKDKDIENITIEDFELVGYFPYARVNLNMAV